MNANEQHMCTERQTALLIPHLMLPEPRKHNEVETARKVGMAALSLNRTDWEAAAAVFAGPPTKEEV